jgi:hypothetical protein
MTYQTYMFFAGRAIEFEYIDLARERRTGNDPKFIVSGSLYDAANGPANDDGWILIR